MPALRSVPTTSWPCRAAARERSPVPVGSELRMGVTVAGVDDVEGGVQVTYDMVMEVKDAPKPACVAQVVYRYYR